MKITTDTVGTLIRIRKGKEILVTSVTPKYVYYFTKGGGRYATKEREIKGKVVNDPKAITAFLNAYNEARLEDMRKAKAFRTIFDLRKPVEERVEALSKI